MKISSAQIKQIEKDLASKFDVSTGNLRKILTEIYNVTDPDKAKKITSRAILKAHLCEVNRPHKEKFDDTGDSKYLAKCWGIFPLTGTKIKGSYKEELMTYSEARRLGEKKVSLNVFTTRRKTSIRNMTREIDRSIGLLDYFN